MASALFLCGMPGSGKSSLGKKLSLRLKIKFIDLDQWIAQRTGINPTEWIEQYGESAFREAEAKALREIPLQEPLVVACGGGTPCFHENLAYMFEQGIVARIDLPLTTLIQRLSSATPQRPLLANGSLEERIPALWEARKWFYLQVVNVLSPLKQSELEMAALCRAWMAQHR
jgi:shikimate kinase